MKKVMHCTGREKGVMSVMCMWATVRCCSLEKAAHRQTRQNFDSITFHTCQFRAQDVE